MKHQNRYAIVLSKCLTWGALLGLPAACAEQPAPSGEQAPQPEFGALHVALQTGNGVDYHLTGAVFTIRDESDTEVVILSSDTDGGVSLDADLPQGRYTIELASGWSLKELTGATESTVQAALISANPASFVIKHQHVTELSYVFATDDGTVTLGEGSVSVGVDVVHATTLGDCSPLDPNTCSGGQTCLLADDSGETFCAAAGDIEVGQPCDSDQCVAGAQCLSTGSDAGSAKVCTEFCDPRSSSLICDCRSLSFSEDLGVCAGPAACEPNCSTTSTFTFTDYSYSDDVSGAAMYDFFASLNGIDSTSYLRVEFSSGYYYGGSAWCSGDAASYINNYLSYSPSYGYATSNYVDQYYRYYGGAWYGPTYSQYGNYYGGNCGSSYAWCSEWGLGGNYLVLDPQATGSETNGGNGTVVTISVAATRSEACGF